MIIDLLFIILMVMAVFKGYSRGLIVALFSMLAFVIGIAAAMKLSTVVANRLSDHFTVSNQWLPIISFAIVFIAVVLLVRLGAKLVEKTFQLAMLGWANRLAGIILFIALYTILYSVVLFYAARINLIRPETIAKSVTYPYIQPWGPWIIDGFGQIVPIFKNMFSDLETFFDNMAKKSG